MADININEVYEELKYLGDLPETSRLIKDYLALREEDATLRALVKEMADVLDWCNKQADSIGAASLLPVSFPMISLTMTMAAMSQHCNKIVAKAREEVKDGK